MRNVNPDRFDSKGNCRCDRIGNTCLQCSACDECEYYVHTEQQWGVPYEVTRRIEHSAAARPYLMVFGK